MLDSLPRALQVPSFRSNRGAGPLAAALLLGLTLGCRSTAVETDPHAPLRQAEETVLRATQQSDAQTLWNFMPDELKAAATAEDLGRSLAQGGRELVSWQIVLIEPRELPQADDTVLQGFAVQVKAQMRQTARGPETREDRWTDLWVGSDAKWIWWGRE